MNACLALFSVWLLAGAALKPAMAAIPEDTLVLDAGNTEIDVINSQGSTAGNGARTVVASVSVGTGDSLSANVRQGCVSPQQQVYFWDSVRYAFYKIDLTNAAYPRTQVVQPTGTALRPASLGSDPTSITWDFANNAIIYVEYNNGTTFTPNGSTAVRGVYRFTPSTTTGVPSTNVLVATLATDKRITGLAVTQTGTLYAILDNFSLNAATVVRIDPGNTYTDVDGNAGTNTGFQTLFGLSWDFRNQRLLVFDQAQSQAAAKIVSLDPITGTRTLVSSGTSSSGAYGGSYFNAPTAGFRNTANRIIYTDYDLGQHQQGAGEHDPTRLVHGQSVLHRPHGVGLRGTIQQRRRPDRLHPAVPAGHHRADGLFQRQWHHGHAGGERYLSGHGHRRAHRADPRRGLLAHEHQLQPAHRRHGRFPSACLGGNRRFHRVGQQPDLRRDLFLRGLRFHVLRDRLHGDRHFRHADFADRHHAHGHGHHRHLGHPGRQRDQRRWRHDHRARRRGLDHGQQLQSGPRPEWRQQFRRHGHHGSFHRQRLASDDWHAVHLPRLRHQLGRHRVHHGDQLHDGHPAHGQFADGERELQHRQGDHAHRRRSEHSPADPDLQHHVEPRARHALGHRAQPHLHAHRQLQRCGFLPVHGDQHLEPDEQHRDGDAQRRPRHAHGQPTDRQHDRRHGQSHYFDGDRP